MRQRRVAQTAAAAAAGGTARVRNRRFCLHSQRNSPAHCERRKGAVFAGEPRLHAAHGGRTTDSHIHEKYVDAMLSPLTMMAGFSDLPQTVRADLSVCLGRGQEARRRPPLPQRPGSRGAPSPAPSDGPMAATRRPSPVT